MRSPDRYSGSNDEASSLNNFTTGSPAAAKSLQSCLTLCDPVDIQAMEFSRTEYWSG